MRLTSSLIAALILSLAPGALAQESPPATPQAPAKLAKKEKKPDGPVASLLGFEAIQDGGSRIYVELTGNVTVTQHESKGQLVFVLEGAQIRTGNTQNSLELYYHDTPVLRAKLRKAKPDKKDKKEKKPKKIADTELILEMKSDVKPTQRLVEGHKGTYRLEVDFPAGNYRPVEGTPPPKNPEKKK